MANDKQPMVSIVIPVYNGSNFMREAIDSALAQTYENIEVLVVNDGSADDGATRGIALSYGDRIRYFEKENGGVSTALNLGLREMRGEYFSWLSHDDWYRPEKVEHEMSALLVSGNAELAAFCDCDFVEWPAGTTYRDSYLRYGRELAETGWFAAAMGLISGCTLLIPKRLFEKYGGFDENERAVQDYLKWFELFRKRRLAYVDEPLVCSRIHGGQVTANYAEMSADADKLYRWMASSLTESELRKAGLDLYEFYGVYLARWLSKPGFQFVKEYVRNRMLELPEPADACSRRKALAAKLREAGNGQVYVYCVGEFGNRVAAELRWRGCPADGIADSDSAMWGHEVQGLICESPQELPKEALIIVANVKPLPIREYLLAQGFRHVQTCMDWDNDFLHTPIQREACELLA